ncbi:MAG: FecR domain-containing protein [Bacteriovoracaceae bacterium]|jgi:hypothetical protein|nr:FecR domain-containing protein [Bacteriovoracaceae bacterium]
MKNILIILSLTFISLSKVYARASIAKADWVRGHVTKLDPNSKKAVILKKGDLLYEDTSIVTSKKSIVRVRFANNSVLTLGQNSKFIIEEMKNKESTLVNLLMGQLRAKVDKAKTGQPKNKFIMKTRTAAVGVRGTEFLTVYNPTGQNTSLVTIEGEVAMKKVVKKRGIVDQSHVNSMTEKAANSSTSKVDVFEKVLSESDTVIIKKGRFSGVNSNFLKASKPVKISAKQFIALREDAALESHIKEATKLKGISSKQIEEVAKEIDAVEVVDPKKEGFFNEKTGEFAPKSGGILDTSTGIYVQPPNDAKYNDGTKAYEIDESIGHVSVGGGYIPPAGLALDSNKGFVAIAAVDNKEDEEKIKALNKTIATSLPIPKEQINKKSKINKHQLYFSLGPASINSELSDINLVSNTNNVARESGGSQYTFSWSKVWGKKISSEFKISQLEADVQQSYNSFNTEKQTKTLLYLNSTIGHKTWSRFSTKFSLILKDILVPTIRGSIQHMGNDYSELLKEISPRFSLGTTYHAYKGDMFTFNLDFDIIFFAAVSITNTQSPEVVELMPGIGMNFRAEGRWKVFTRYFVALYMRHTSEDQDVKIVGGTAINNDFKAKYTEDSVGLILGYEF